MPPENRIREFDGYRGLFCDFWGFSEEDLMDFNDLSVTEVQSKLGVFWDMPVVIVNDVPEGHWLMAGFSGRDLKVSTLELNGLGVPCVDLSAEGFASRLFLVSDLPRLQSEGTTLLVDDFVLQDHD